MRFSGASIAILLLPVLTNAIPARNAYDGTQVMRIRVGDSAESAQKLDDIIKTLDLDMWTHQAAKINSHVDVEVPREKLDSFAKEIKSNYETEVMHGDLGASIKAESERFGTFDFKATAVPDISWFSAYHPYADHLKFLQALVAKYPSNAEIIVAGNSYNKDPITGIHIYGSGGKGSKPAVIWHGTVHAREWITTMTTEYLAYTLLTNYGNSSEIAGFVDNYDFYVFPVVNPDGFQYTQTTQRLWRKNRQPTEGSSCVGHDINRNWPWKWDLTGGASTNPCDQDFRGASAGDTPESKVLGAFANKLSASPAGAKQFIDWHSYSQLFMTPYGYTCSSEAADNDELVSLAQGASAAIQAVNGKEFTSGPICTTIYQATGNSVDYAYDVSKIKYSFTIELRDTGRYGFVLPPDQILPSGIEAWAAMRYLLQNMK